MYNSHNTMTLACLVASLLSLAEPLLKLNNWEFFKQNVVSTCDQYKLMNSSNAVKYEA